MTNLMTLNGPWRLLPVDVFRHGFYPLDAAGWIEQELPAHWQQHPLLERYVGRMVYRKRFTLNERPAANDQANGHRRDGLAAIDQPPSPRYWLRLNGVFYWSRPYFNGVDLGRHEGYFAPQEHEVTPWLADENTLVVEVECPNERDKYRKRMITGVFSHWDCMDPHANPGGIWLPVEIVRTGPVRIKEVLVQTEHVSEAAAELRFRATLDSAAAADVTLRWTIAPKNFAGEVQVVEQRRALAQGVQEIVGTVPVRDPQLWWTHDMGHPNCYTLTLSVLHGSRASDEHRFTYGIRRFELRNWIPYLNGVRFFIKGSNYAPGDARIATVNRESCERDVRLARDCHMNMLRVHAHVDHPALYEAADEAGVLLWQDMPLQWYYAPSVLPEAGRQVRQMIRLLYNHPSVVVWCMHNEPMHIKDPADERPLTLLRIGFSVFFWNWNRDVMDNELKRIAQEEDCTRPSIRSSGEFSVPFMPKGTDTHFYGGWYIIFPRPHHWASWIRRFPKNIRFVSEFGAQSFPNIESSRRFMDPDIAKIDWETLARRHQFQANVMSHWLDWRNAPSLEELVRQTQDYQIAINRFHIDRLRFFKYRPTGGILPFMFNDPFPAVLWSIVDYWRIPKRSYAALRRAFSPQYAFTLFDQETYAPGHPIDLPIYVVNDAQRDVPIELSARLTAPDGEEIGRVERRLTLPPDCMAIEADRLRLHPPRTGTYRLALAIADGNGLALENEYEVLVAAEEKRDVEVHDRTMTSREEAVG